MFSFFFAVYLSSLFLCPIFLPLTFPLSYIIILPSILFSRLFLFPHSFHSVCKSLSFRLREYGFYTITWLSHRSVLRAHLVSAVSWLTAWAWVKLYRSSLSLTSCCATPELTPCSPSSLWVSVCVSVRFLLCVYVCMRVCFDHLCSLCCQFIRYTNRYVQ